MCAQLGGRILCIAEPHPDLTISFAGQDSFIGGELVSIGLAICIDRVSGSATQCLNRDNGLIIRDRYAGLHFGIAWPKGRSEERRVGKEESSWWWAWERGNTRRTDA